VELLLATVNQAQRLGEGIEGRAADVAAAAASAAAVAAGRPASEEALRNEAFLAAAHQTPASALLEPLCELMHFDNRLAQTLWSEVFPLVWAALAPDEQQALHKPLGLLVARDNNKQQELRRPNVVQGLLESIVR
jgi:hypothetical protein